MAEAERVLIRHKTDGREYSILEKDFEREGVVRISEGVVGSYRDAGFQIVGPDNKPRRNTDSSAPKPRAPAKRKRHPRTPEPTPVETAAVNDASEPAGESVVMATETKPGD